MAELNIPAAPVIDGTAANSSEELKVLSEHLVKISQEGGGTQRSTAAMANLAEGIQGLVRNMRTEQQMLRDWIEAQQEESRLLRRTLDKLSEKIEGK